MMPLLQFVKRLLGNSALREPTETLQQVEEAQALALLGQSLYPNGVWLCWDQDYTNTLGLHLDRTQLYFPPLKPGLAPDTSLLVRLEDIQSVSFMSKISLGSDKSARWFDQLAQASASPLAISPFQVAFNQPALALSLIRQAKTIETIHGYWPKRRKFLRDPYQLVFWCGDYGLAASAHSLRLTSVAGPLPIVDIPQRYEAWSAYYNAYWLVKDTPEAMPSDPCCDVIIPAS